MPTKTLRRPGLAALQAGQREVRTFFTELEARDTDGLAFVLDGYASLTGTPYDMGWYEEVIERGAFSRSLAERPDVQLLVNHEGLPLARSTLPPSQPGHLSLSEDSRGLHDRQRGGPLRGAR